MNDMDEIIEWLKSRPVKEAAVVGGGFIGLEMLEQLAKHEADVLTRNRTALNSINKLVSLASLVRLSLSQT